MKDTIKTNNKLKSYFIFIIGIILLTISILIALYDYKLEQKAININATITSVDYDKGKPKATVKYNVDSEIYHQTISVSESEKLAIDDKVAIKYDMTNPGKLINNNHSLYYISLFTIAILMLIISFPSTIKYIKKSSNIKKLKTKGIYINGNIVEVIINNKGRKYKGNYPYKLRCKYLNPLDKKEYIFDSDDTYINLNDVIAKYHNQIVIVYLDKDNTSNYYVDLDSLFPQVQLVDVGALMGENKEKEPLIKKNAEGDKNIKDEEKDSTKTIEEEK